MSTVLNGTIVCGGVGCGKSFTFRNKRVTQNVYCPFCGHLIMAVVSSPSNRKPLGTPDVLARFFKA